jgi:GrpB-like predicted nucleotidyltransferase (UPF0157 family)
MAAREEDDPTTKTTTEEEIRAYTIGELKPLTTPILVSDYDPDWPLSFEREAARIRSVLGGRVKLLEHAGSTSVVGLPAKPIIDMILAVPDSSDESTYVQAMETAGYVLRIREPHWFEHRVFKGPDTNINLHVFTVGCAEIDQMLLFRDWLRAHPEERDLYAAKKRELAKQDWKFVQHYADAKTGIVHEILARARAGK